MTNEQYEQRKLRLAEQLQEGVALLEQGYQRQLRALELIWMANANGAAAPPGPESPPAAASGGLVEKPARPRLAAGQLLEDLRAALPQLPEAFDRNSLIRGLGYEPERSSLHRAVASLIREGAVVLDSKGAGKIPAKYRKADP